MGNCIDSKTVHIKRTYNPNINEKFNLLINKSHLEYEEGNIIK